MGPHRVPWARLPVVSVWTPAPCAHPGVRCRCARRRVSSFEELWLVSRPVIPVSAPSHAQGRSPLPPGSTGPVARSAGQGSPPGLGPRRACPHRRVSALLWASSPTRESFTRFLIGWFVFSLTFENSCVLDAGPSHMFSKYFLSVCSLCFHFGNSIYRVKGERFSQY